MTTQPLLKDQLFNKEKVEYLSELIKKAYPAFKEKKFVKIVLAEFPKLELKERIFWMVKQLEFFLPNKYEEALEIIVNSLPNELDTDKTDGDFGDFILAPLGHFVSEYGCSKKHLKKSLIALEEMNKRFSTEFEIRDFLNKFEDETFAIIFIWSKNKNYHLRRLASEGTRPKLPWAKRINLDYRKAIKILDNLYFDKTRYVTRSVANHLNDISKMDSDLVVKTLKRWKKENKQTEKEIDFIIKHSLRTLVKKGNVKALQFLGFEKNPKIKILNFEIKNRRIKIGEKLEFSFEILAEQKENLMVDYKIIYSTPNNRHSEKIFKIKTTKIKKDEKIVIAKKHPFKKMTTKRLYSGDYKLEIQINGKIVDSTNFYVKV